MPEPPEGELKESPVPSGPQPLPARLLIKFYSNLNDHATARRRERDHKKAREAELYRSSERDRVALKAERARPVRRAEQVICMNFSSFCANALAFRGATAMTDWHDSHEPRHSISVQAMNLSCAGLKELMTWDLFKWSVVAILAANLLFIVGLYSRTRSDLADLKQDRTALDHAIGETQTALADSRTTLGKDIATAKAGLDQAVSEMRSSVSEMRSSVEEEIAKANAKLDTLIEASRKPQSEKPRR